MSFHLLNKMIVTDKLFFYLGIYYVKVLEILRLCGVIESTIYNHPHTLLLSGVRSDQNNEWKDGTPKRGGKNLQSCVFLYMTGSFKHVPQLRFTFFRVIF